MLASSLLLFLVAVASICATLPAVGASSSIVVSANVPSATRLNRLNCAPGSAGRTDFGVVQPGSSAVTSLSCDIEFGSSNATSSLRIRQADEHGRAMWTYGIGQLDGTFDGAAAGNGVVPIDALSSNDYFESAALRPGGGVVAVGGASDGSDTDVLVVALLENGNPDPSFGDGDGIEVVAVSATLNDSVRAVQVLPDGRMVVVGLVNNGVDNDALILRLEADGDLDPTFSGDGILTVAPSSLNDDFRDVNVASNGDIVAVGKTRITATEDALLVRVRDDGTLRNTFDGDGVVVVDSGGWEALQGIAFAPDGDIIATGNTMFGDQEHLALRMSADGVLDPLFDGDTSTPSFPGNGYARYDMSGTNLDVGEGIGVDLQGRILIPGRTNPGTGEDASIMRIDATTGALDDTFDGDGFRIVPAFTSGTDRALGAPLVQPDGRIVIAGLRNATNPDGWIRRLNDDGSNDTSFATSSLYVLDLSINDRLTGVFQGWDGRIMSVGRTEVSAFDRATVVRLAGGSDVLDYQTGVDDWTPETTSMFGACLASVTGGAATWASDGTCNLANGTEWRGVGAASSIVATAALGVDTAVAQLRFGFRAGTQQVPAVYVAPLSFDVMAP